MGKKYKINDILIFVIYLIIIIGFSIISFEMVTAKLNIAVIGTFLGNLIMFFIYRKYCIKKRVKPGYKLNFIPAVSLMLLFIICGFFHLVFLVISYAFVRTESKPMTFEIDEFMPLLLLFIVALSYYIVSLINNSKSRKRYYRISFIFMILCNSLSILAFYSNMFLVNNSSIPVIFSIFALFLSIELVLMTHHIITLFNLSLYKRFFGIKEGIKVFLVSLFKRNLGYYIGIVFVILIGIFYLLASAGESYYRYAGYYFILFGIARIVIYFWNRKLSDKSIKKRYHHQYIMLITTSIILLATIYWVWKILEISKQIESSSLDVFSFVLGVILIVRIIVVIFGFYYSRINVKKEPISIALNNLSIVSVLVATYIFFVKFLLSVGVGKYDMNTVMNIFSMVIVVLVSIVIVTMLIRAIIGIIKTRRMPIQ